MTLNKILLAVTWALSLVLAALTGYFRTYASKKGENLATKEDIAELTRLTKEVEAKVSEDLWSKQRHLELKKEVAFEAVRELGTLQWRVPVINAVANAARNPQNFATQTQAQEALRTLAQEADKTVAALGRATVLTWIVCSIDVKNKIGKAHAKTVDIVARIINGNISQEEVSAIVRTMGADIDAVTQAIRVDLELPPH